MLKMDRDQLIGGANLMLKVAKEVLAKQTARKVNQMLLHDDQDSDADEDSAWDGGEAKTSAPENKRSCDVMTLCFLALTLAALGPVLAYMFFWLCLLLSF